MPNPGARLFGRPRQLSGAHVLYRDMVDYREAEADVAAEVSKMPLLWRPDNIHEPSDALAVIGILTSYAVTNRMDRVSWSGDAIHGYASLVDDLIMGIGGSFSADDSQMSLLSDGQTIMRLPLDGCRYWAGQITARRIWETCREAVLEAAEKGETDINSMPVDFEYSGVNPPSATGYDRRACGNALDDGFAISAHPDIILNGQRPAIEMYSLIGAAQLSAWGRWPTRDNPRIPNMASIALRDYVDLERFVWIAAKIHTVTRMSGKRRILAAR